VTDVLPRLLTARLAMRELTPADAEAIERLSGGAAAWYPPRIAAEEHGQETGFAIARLADGALVGSIGLAIEPALAAARLWCWIGPAWRGRGYAAEAAGAVVAHGFETLELERIWAPRLRADAAAARVLQRIGLAHEGSRFVVERGAAARLESHGCLRWEYFARVARCGSAGAAQ
jgi:RimJ/RimL family protein N-acetyltransferase